MSSSFSVTVQEPGDRGSHELEISGTYSPPAAPPRTSDPDHPGFSDPGDGGEIEIDEITLVRKKSARSLVGKILDNLRSDQALEKRIWNQLLERE